MTLRQKIAIPVFMWILSFMALYHLTNEMIPNPFFLLFLVPVIVFFTIKDRVSFLVFILVTLVTALSALILAFIDNWTTPSQLKWIGIHSLIILNIWSIYVISKWSYTTARKNEVLSKRVEELEEHIIDTTILTNREFEKQKNIISTAMKRKKEGGYIVKIGLQNLPKNVRKISFIKIADCTVQTVRAYYDIVGKLDDVTITILLQDIDRTGLEKVENRLRLNLEKKFTHEALSKLTYEKETIGYQPELSETTGDKS